MKCVGVRHQAGQDKLFWFVVPDELCKFVHIKSKVYCSTQHGVSSGVVEGVGEYVKFEDDDPIVKAGNLTANESVVNFICSLSGRDIRIGDIRIGVVTSVIDDVPLSEIHVPWRMASSSPSSEKIAKRVQEFYDFSDFETRVVIDEHGNLIDGYTAYLVAKMFDHETLKAERVASLKAGDSD